MPSTSRKAVRRTTNKSASAGKVAIAEITGDFAEDKDAAASIREEHIRSAVGRKTELVLDFTGVTLVTQSFIHALISDVLRSAGEEALRYVIFEKCKPGVRGIVETVVQYSLETMDEEEGAPPNKRLQPTARLSSSERSKERARRG